MNDAMPTTYSYYKAYSSVKRPFNKKTTNYNTYFNKRVNTVKSTRVNIAMSKAEVNTIKASARWVWKPKHEELDHVFTSNSASKTLTRCDYVDALGRELSTASINNNDEDTAEFKDLSTVVERFSKDASKQGRIHDAYTTVTKEQKVDDDKETSQEVRKCLDTSS
ncbi:hypothetical protein Tco_0569205 [Tanacetum coccineum]